MFLWLIFGLDPWSRQIHETVTDYFLIYKIQAEKSQKTVAVVESTTNKTEICLVRVTWLFQV
jgi:hypothetical protein